jgi:hypothetical protein
MEQSFKVSELSAVAQFETGGEPSAKLLQARKQVLRFAQDDNFFVWSI